MSRFTEARRDEVVQELRRRARPQKDKGKNIEVVLMLAYREAPSQDDLKAIADELYSEFGGYWLAEYYVAYVRRHNGGAFVELHCKHRTPPDDPYPV